MDLRRGMVIVSFKYRGKKLTIKAREVGFFGRIIGLMFASQEEAEVLLFRFPIQTKTSIHSFFVFFPFIAVWLNEKNRVIDVKLVKPFQFSISPKKDFTKLIEIPVNKNHSKIVKIVSRRS